MEYENGVQDREGIFKGCSEIVSDFLGPGIESLNQLKQKTTYQGLKDSGKTEEDFKMLLGELYKKIESNRTERDPSKKNWRNEGQTYISDQNESDEVLLERAIAILGKRNILPGWINQVPVASGLVSSSSDNRAAIDLVLLESNSAEFIELKWNRKTDTPAYAAFEILLYGLAYLYCFVRKGDMGYMNKELMNIGKLSLRVLAPYDYYAGGNLIWLKRGIDTALRSFSLDETNAELSIDFAFYHFPEEFNLPFSRGKEVSAFDNLPPDDPGIQSVVAAVLGRKVLW